MSKQFEYETTLNGGIVSVFLDITEEHDEDGMHVYTNLDSVWYECTDVTGILDQQTLSALEMEAESVFFDSGDGGFNPARDAFQLGE